LGSHHEVFIEIQVNFDGVVHGACFPVINTISIMSVHSHAMSLHKNLDANLDL